MSKPNGATEWRLFKRFKAFKSFKSIRAIENITSGRSEIK
jgi:hypothetical protein